MAAPVRVSSAPTVSISQAQFLVGALIVAFIVWLLINGRLAQYWALLTGGGSLPTPATTATGTTATGSGSTTSIPGVIAGTLQQLGSIWVWKDATTGATRFSPTPPAGYVPQTATPAAAPTTTAPATAAPSTGTGGG